MPRHPVHIRRWLGLLGWWVVCLGPAAARPDVAQVQAVRAAEMASCLPGEETTWPDGRDRPASGPVQLAYTHTGAPAWFSASQVRQALARATQAWSACGVPGTLLPPEAPGPAGAVQVAWSDTHTRGHFALADLGQRRLWLSAAMFQLLADRNPRHPAGDTLQMTISHEMGHFFGLVAHSRRCVDVMSYYRFGPDDQSCSTRGGVDWRALPEYRATLPTACDIERCQRVNGTR
ncbi:MAG: hypothetical protein ACK5QH_19155 [Rubrivivax sp.]